MDPINLQLWSVIGTWLASIGTVSAVITSLWLAYHQDRVKLRVVAGHRLIVSRGLQDTPEYCMVKVVNVGSKPAKVVSVGWEAGCFKNKINMIQVFGTPGFDDVPKMLQEGEEANFMVPFHLHGDEEDWIVSLPKKLIEGGKNRIKSLKAVVHTSVGQTFKVKVEKGLIKKLEQSLKAKKSSQPNAKNGAAT